MSNTMNIVKTVYRSENSRMLILELITGEKVWSFGPTAGDIPVGFSIGLNRFSAHVSDAFWQAMGKTWIAVK